MFPFYCSLPHLNRILTRKHFAINNKPLYLHNQSNTIINLKLTIMKNFLRLSLASLLMLFCGTIFAAEPYKVLTFPDDDSENNSISAYNKTWTAKIGGDSWTITSFNNNNWKNWTYIRCGWKTDATVASIATDFAIDQPISSVVVTIDKFSTPDKVNSIKLVVASDASFSNVIETVEAPNKEAGEMTFTVTKPTANCYYKVEFDCQQTSDNGIIQVSKVAYYKEGDAPVIVDISNTPETAYTVAKAHELTEAGEGLATEVYIKGVVTQIDEVSPQFGNATYYINDTKDNTEGQLMVFRGNYFDGDKFTSEDQLKVGDEVVIYGQLSVYNGEHQVAQGSSIYSLNGKTEPEAPSVDISNTPETAYTVAKANELIAAGEGLETKVYVKGLVTQIDEISAQFGNATYYINDVDDIEGQLQVFRGKYFDGEKFTSEDQLKYGDEVIVYGTLENHGGKYEITNSEIHSLNGKTEPDDEPVVNEPVACENIAAVKAQEAGALVALTLKDAQVVYVNSYQSGEYTNTEYFVRDASGAIDLYNTGLELKVNDVINGVAVFKYSPYKGLPELVKADETNAEGLTITEGAEAQPVEITDVADLLTDKYLCDLVTVKNVTVTSEQTGDFTDYFAVDENESMVMLYDKFKLGIELPADNEKYDITGILGTFNETTNEVFLLNIEKNIPSGINKVEAEELDENAPVYNLAGQRVSKDTKGIVIQNGKKFVNK